MSKYLLEITIFLCGAIVMIFEIVGSRIYGPYFGTSTFVWTSLIGVILGSLSLGYYIGGKLSDNKPSYEKLSSIILLSGIFVFISYFIKDSLLSYASNLDISYMITILVTAIFIFAPASFFLGIVSPYAVRLKMNNLKNSGEVIGSMYAIGTFGSIFGTFLAGFYLVPTIGTNALLVLLSLLLVIISLFVSKNRYFKFKIFIIVFLIFVEIFLYEYKKISIERGLIDVDTQYSRIKIYDYTHAIAKKRSRIMQINSENHSSMFIDSDELVNNYTDYYHLVSHFNPDFKHGLMIGGAGYSFPKSYLQNYPEKTLDVVEIDPGVTELAKKYFNLKEDNRLNIFHEGARAFLNNTDLKYDAIFGDAFSSYYSIPYQLTTLEAIQKHYDVLNDNGVVLLNIISSIEGEKGEFLRAELATYKEVFPQVYVIAVSENYSGKSVKNLILVAIKSNKQANFTTNNKKSQNYLNNLWTKEIILDMPILTDDFAPVNKYIKKAVR